MADQATAIVTLFTEFYFFLTIVLMFFIHIGFCMYEVGVSRTKNVQHTLLKNAMAIPVVGLAFFLFGMWIYIALQGWPVGSPTVSFATGFEPWSEKLAPNLSDRISGVFWAAFALFGMTAASIVSGSIIERVKTTGFLIIAVYVGAVAWVIPAAWGWSGNGWMTQYLGFHDQYCSAVLHAPAGFATLGILLDLGPRIGKFGPDGTPREIPAHNPWMVTIGLFMIYVGFFGFYAACHIPIVNIAAEGQPAYWTATNIYGVPITLSGVTMNFLLALFGGMMTAYLVSGGNAFWTFSGGLTGLDQRQRRQRPLPPGPCPRDRRRRHRDGLQDAQLGREQVQDRRRGRCGRRSRLLRPLRRHRRRLRALGLSRHLSERRRSGRAVGRRRLVRHQRRRPADRHADGQHDRLAHLRIGFGFIPGYVLGMILKVFGLLRVDPKVELDGSRRRCRLLPRNLGRRSGLRSPSAQGSQDLIPQP